MQTEKKSTDTASPHTASTSEASEILEFYGGKAMACLPVVLFLIACVEFFIVLKAFDMTALAAAALIALMVTALCVKKASRQNFWKAVYDGAREAVPIVVLLLVIGIFAQLIKLSNLSGGFVWIAQNLHVIGGLFTALTFLFVCIIATATGSSLGTMFTCFPIFYPAGVLLGADPAFLAAAIVGGGIFGDNLAPISDTTIISTSTQHYTTKAGNADVGGAVRSRFKYSAVAGILAFIILALFSGGSTSDNSTALSQAQANPQSLYMLIAVAIMLGVAIAFHDIYLSITIGIICALAIGLATGLVQTTDIISVEDGTITGFIADGVSGMTGTVILVLSVYGIMGVLHKAGILDLVLNRLYQSKMATTARGTEIIMMCGTTLTTLLFGGVTSASMTTFGKIHNELGQRAGLHPYRRANLLDGFANGIALCVPFLSVFVFLGAQLSQGYENVAAVSVLDLSTHMIYPFLLFAVLLFSVLTGWGRTFEGENGQELRQAVPAPHVLYQ
ncbi:Na+/H+ antiporter NhaC family protein [Alloscardovia criceti]|uniref:Na+/H+ antiporter NhaC family protein n=1 Tax=Alloscardovia criceti TaxID=356828 RepID=UPI00036FC3E1|nr:Na+/H+ antiporter NhaC family protein [Alloscardovia criceti]